MVMSSINNTDDGDDFFASFCKWTNNTVVHGDGTIDRKWITVTIDMMVLLIMILLPSQWNRWDWM